jgi:hypothetical protein
MCHLLAKYLDKLGSGAVQMIAEVRTQYPSRWPANNEVAGMLGDRNVDTAAGPGSGNLKLTLGAPVTMMRPGFAGESTSRQSNK